MLHPFPPLAVTVMLPPGVPAPGGSTDSKALTETGSPCTLGSGAADSCNWVAARATTWVRLPLLPR